jgi:3',5'-cyclic AMP phosphodiesterase CpdA
VLRAALIAALLAAVLAPVASAVPRDTTVRTIVDRDGDNRLEFGPGEDYTYQGDGAPPRVEGSILNFLQLSDFQVVDEESPGRVEFLDETQQPPLNPVGAAYRPQEALSPFFVEAMVRQARNSVSPLTHEQLELALLTGDNADSQQYNETRWFIDMLDGQKKIDPNSGIEGVCDPTPGQLYDGVRDGGREQGYYEPDASAGGEDGRGYTPNRQENQAETGRDVTVRDFPGLLEAAQHRFESVGLDMPWYSAFGNHDALIQGNSPEAYIGPDGPSGEQSNDAFQRLVTGCVKPSKLPPGVAADDIASIFGDPAAAAPLTVPPDFRRCYLAKDASAPLFGGAPPPCGASPLVPGPLGAPPGFENTFTPTGGWIQQHFITTGTPVGHGFSNRPPTAVANHDGYYSFSPRPGLRFAVLDTVTDDCGAGVQVCAEGSIDDQQFEWLRGEFEAAAAAGQYVITFSHHTMRTTRSPDGDATEQPVHYGEVADRRDGQPLPPSPSETLEQLHCEHPNVLAHVAGHEHQNFVEHHECAADQPPTPGGGDFWEISTAAHLDWPQQARMIELIDNPNGRMSLALTMLDHDGPPEPGGAPPDPNANGASGEQVLKLASIGRELAYNDYQASRAANGTPADRNTILPLAQPWPYGSD